MVVVDSSVLIEFLRGSDGAEVQALESLLVRGVQELVAPDLVVFEVLRGCRNPAELKVANELFNTLKVESICSPALARRAAQDYRLLRSLGWTVRSSIDGLVASYCIQSQQRLLHRDRDFSAYVAHCGLRSWTPPAALQ
ncbi:PIN domain-containing protein [Roseateles sp.]|uniref:type II toxin-antitoxin system VapC family toxin n=1 Tax=Roseateles sp. TaxID=1971397 RepID=UPI003920E2AE